MTRVSVNELTTYRWTFEEDVAHYVAAGIQAVGVWRQKLCDFGEDKGVELLADSGLAVSNVLWAGGFTGSDGRTYRDSIEDGLEAVELAGLLKCDCLVVYSGARGPYAQSRPAAADRGLAELAPRAAEHGVKLALEPMHPGCAGEWTFLETLDDALQIASRIDSAQIKLAFDSYHFGFDAAAVSRLEQLAPEIAIVHLGDGTAPPCGEQNRCPLGEGRVPLGAIIEALFTAATKGTTTWSFLAKRSRALTTSGCLSTARLPATACWPGWPE